jgi:hypothetical protein
MMHLKYSNSKYGSRVTTIQLLFALFICALHTTPLLTGAADAAEDGDG